MTYSESERRGPVKISMHLETPGEDDDGLVTASEITALKLNEGQRYPLAYQLTCSDVVID